jgi:protein O-mannosyl-transferase
VLARFRCYDDLLKFSAQRLARLLPVAIAALAFLAFLPALSNGFINWDDETNFLSNPNFRGLGWTQLHWMWTTHLLGRYVPITWMTLGLDYCLWSMNPLGYHLSNLVWHAANAVLFYFVALALFRRTCAGAATPIAALLAALIFAVHPLRVESVAWITERRDLVSGFFYLLAILIYLRAIPDDPPRAIRVKHYWASLALFTLAVLSKEIAVTLPAILLILDFYPLRRFTRTAARNVLLEKIPFFAIALAVSAMALYNGYHEKTAETLAHLGLFDRLAIVTYGLAFYVRKTLLPIDLTPIYALTPERLNPLGAPFLASAACVLAAIAIILIFRRRFPALPAAALAYAITLIPVSGLFHNGRQIAADRYSYLSCLPWALVAAAGLSWIARRRPGAVNAMSAIAACGILALGILTWRQTKIWHDSDTLWSHALAVEPSYLTYSKMGDLLVQEGDVLWSIEWLRRSTTLKPDYAPAHLNLASALLALHRTSEAIAEYQKVLDLGEAREFAENGLGCALALDGQREQAIAHFEQALRINPTYQDARRNLDAALAQKP